MLINNLILYLSALTITSTAKHLYIPLNKEVCFYENLEQEQILNGKVKVHFNMPEIIKNELGMKYNLNLDVKVLETFDENHMPLKEANGINHFTFTALDNGEHAICVKPFVPNFNARRLKKEGFTDKVKVYIDFEKSSLGNIMDIISQQDSKFLLSSKVKVNQILAKLKIIKMEQIKFREKYRIFLKISNDTNSRIITWGVVQVVWMTLICVYQLKFLKQLFIRHKVL
ncbi:unnamed protein product [Hanseniaspora opuntiae]